MDSENEDDFSFEERRHLNKYGYGRRESDKNFEINVDSFKLSLREAIIVTGAIIGCLSTVFGFNSSLDKQHAEVTLKFELFGARISSLESNQVKLEKQVDDLEQQLSDLERTITQLYNKEKK